MARPTFKAKKHRYLSILVALALTAGGVSEARDHQVIEYDGHKVFDLIYFDSADQGNWVQDYFWPKQTEAHQTFNYDFSADMKSWMNNVCLQWAEILKPGLANIKNPAQLTICSDNHVGAYDMNWDEPIDKNYVKAALTTGVELPYIDFKEKDASEYQAHYDERGYNGFSSICIGQGIGAYTGSDIYGWTGGITSQNNHPTATVNFNSVLFHEVGHALGVSAVWKEQTIKDGNGKESKVYYFSKLADDPSDFTGHLLDERGVKASAGKIIVSPDAADKEGYSIYTQEQLDDIKANPDQYFQVSTWRDNNSATGKAFFQGKNVLEVLEGKKFWGIDGIPVTGMENGVPQLSHIELERSMMSHQNYWSYNTFMEAELAVMQDIGYKIDRKNFYGRSFYNSDLKGEAGINTHGFFARNEDGTDYLYGQPNTSTLGVGLHIYGSRNEITQTSNGANDGSADLLACGTGAAGIRVDGVENKVTLANDASIEANGKNGSGILVAYGRDHQVNVEGNVSALGDGGDAIRFDFGNGDGETYEYRGSYIRYRIRTDADTKSKKYITSPEDMKIKDSQNWGLLDGADNSYSDTKNGDLGSKMASLKVSGSLAGKSHAIYIAKNAFVDNIDIEDGAEISGDITSDWKHFDDDIYGHKESDDSQLRIQYGTVGHYYNEYCKDLVTNLNINGDFAYSGNITGSDNMKLKVNNEANMTYTGTADVVGVQVAKDASLFGGNYKVNAITCYADGESVDNEAGKFINHGMIGALDGNSNMNIEGNLESDGILMGQAGGDKGSILVSGTADLQPGSGVAAYNGIAGESIPVLTADGGINGAENADGMQMGLLVYDTEVSQDGRSMIAHANAKESLEGATQQQAEDYKTVNEKALEFSKKHPESAKMFRKFYALEKDPDALKALGEMTANDREEPVTAVVSAQRSTINQKILSSRLATALGQSPAMMHIGTSQLADGEDKGVDVPVKLSTEQDKSAWVKFSRNWSKTAAGSNYTGNIITMGYDWKHGDHQRNGVFGSYTDGSFGHNYGNEKLQDTRLGYYIGIHKGADTKLLYADLGYLKGNRSRNVSIPFFGYYDLAKGDYTGWLAEIGGEWKHDLHKVGEKTWQVSPYGSFQMSYMKQRGYRESGDFKSFDVSGGHNFYAALEGGFEFSRYMPKGSFNFRIGLSHALTGTDYESHERSNFFTSHSYTKSSLMDKTHLVTSMAVETEIAPLWQLGAELTFQKGAHDRDIMATLQLRRMW